MKVSIPYGTDWPDTSGYSVPNGNTLNLLNLKMNVKMKIIKVPTKEKEYNRKVKRIRSRMDSIEAKYPYIDFTDSELYHDMVRYGKLINESIYASVNRDYCKSDNPDRMCETCTCWKQARAQSM
jgi:hypothetical protein